MAFDETFLVTALPYSADPAAGRQLSVFVTPRLTPDGKHTTVGDFPRARDWPATLAGAQIVVTITKASGAPVTVVRDVDTASIDSDTWRRVFPESLPVNPWSTPDHAAAQWRTFPAHRAQANSLLVHNECIRASVVEPPTLDQRTSRLFPWLDHEITVAGLLHPGITTTVVGAMPSDNPATPAAGTADFRSDAAAARAYYLRPEEQRKYRDRPLDPPLPPAPPRKPAPVEQAPPDFHRRMALLGDLSPLLRRLGVVLDVELDPELLAGITTISADLHIGGEPVRARQPVVACRVVGTSFTADSTTGDYVGGRLLVGDPERFTVLDLDPDASSLKLEQYLANLPRIAASANNGDGTHAAPSALRGTGFAIARNDRAAVLRQRLTGAPARDAAVLAGTASAPIHLEDITRGVRLEVYDDVSKTWHSLHRRRLTVDVAGAGTVLSDVPDTGLLQGAALTRSGTDPSAPLNLHEVLAGWDGWSLSAPRPGQVFRDGVDLPEDAPEPAPDDEHPVASTTRLERGTLPRLRYGRAYMFRAWTVDLAGNCSPHQVAGPADAGLGGVSGTNGQHIDVDPRLAAQLHAEATTRISALDTEGAVAVGPAGHSTRAMLDRWRVTDRAASTQLSVPSPPFTANSAGAKRPLLAPDAPLVATSRQQRVEAVFDRVAAQAGTLVHRTEAGITADVTAGGLLADLITSGIGPAGHAVIGGATTAPTTTAARPFLRWDPVLEPTVVPRHAYTEGESLLTLVIRSGVQGPGPDGLAMTIVAPEDYAAQTVAAFPQLSWRGDAQRHLLPPKTTQFECELHGLFDAAFDAAASLAAKAAAVKKTLAVGLRESGSLTDVTVADPDTPGARRPQPGVALLTGPSAAPPAVTDPAVLPPGQPLSTGQYVVHDVDTVVVPWLPDPLADGVSMRFPDAPSLGLAGLQAVEGTRLAYGGEWPDRVPWRLVLRSGPTLGARAVDGVLDLALPPGEQLRMRLSSSLRPDTLDLLGLWRSQDPTLQAQPLIADAAADGWLWWLTPATNLRVIHAVPRPVRAPRFTRLDTGRSPGKTTAVLFGGVELHGASTERVDVEATWTEWLDDVAKDGPEQVPVVAAACSFTVDPDEEIAALRPGIDGSGSGPTSHAAEHHLPDTKHRTVTYRPRATTRYREYFDPAVVPTIDDISVLGPARTVDVLSSARPGKPVVRDLIPLLRWSQATEHDQPFALSRTRRGGVRIYLERPWFTTGAGELLAVVLGPRVGGGLLLAPSDDNPDVSQWARDPIFVSEPVDRRSALPLVDPAHVLGIDDRVEPAHPVRPGDPLPAADLAGTPVALLHTHGTDDAAVTVVGYRPEYDPERRLWFVDVAVDPGEVYWPFLRLTVARYQPDSLDGLHLSPVVKCDFVQVLPQRNTVLSRPDDRTARIVVTGPVGVPGSRGADHDPDWGWTAADVAATRTVLARLEHRTTAIGTDLGWRTVDERVLPVAAIDGRTPTWEGVLDLPKSLAAVRPGGNGNWRVTIEEREYLPADAPPGQHDTDTTGPTAFRVVYADHLHL